MTAGRSMMLISSLLVVCSESAIVAPLETLNTNLNYRILDDFIGKVTDATSKFFFTPSIESTAAMTNPMSQMSNSATAHSISLLTSYGESYEHLVLGMPFVLLSILVSSNRFNVESVDNYNNTYSNEKKPRVNFNTLPQYSINTISELPEKVFDDER